MSLKYASYFKGIKKVLKKGLIQNHDQALYFSMPRDSKKAELQNDPHPISIVQSFMHGHREKFLTEYGDELRNHLWEIGYKIDYTCCQ